MAAYGHAEVAMLRTLSIGWLLIPGCGEPKEMVFGSGVVADTAAGTPEGDADVDADADTDLDTAAGEEFPAVYTGALADCTGCHGSGSPSAGLDLSSDTVAFDSLSMGSTVDGFSYVVPGDADSSYVVMKLRGDDGISGDPMPPSGATDAQIDIMVGWINGGAQP